MSVPSPTPVVIAEILSLGLGLPVGTEVAVPLPAVRVAKTGDHEAPTVWEGTPLFQVEVWTADEGQAEDLAYTIFNEWPHFSPHVVSPPEGTPALVHGRWVEVAPYPLPNPDDTDNFRFVLSLGIRLSGVTP